MFVPWAGPEASGWPYPTLGWTVGQWIEEHCVIPDGDHVGEPYLLTDEMWEFVLQHYRLRPNAVAGKWKSAWSYRRSMLVRPQKWGKGPFTAAIICAEAMGPTIFDGYLDDPDHAHRVVDAAASAGASAVVLCDTNGGMLPGRVHEVVAAVTARAGVRIGIHCHNDTGCAVANSLAAVEAGARHVQGTINGYGERTGNANLLTIVANLQTKMGFEVVTPQQLARATQVANVVSEITNFPPYSRQPYVGSSAFAHKGGLHASAIKVDPDLYQHTDPALFGNGMRMLVSDMAGRASVELKAEELGVELGPDSGEAVGRVLATVKELESRGYTFDAADASFELLLRRGLGQDVPHYADIESWRVITDARGDDDALSEATVKVRAGGRRVVATGEGNGPVNALDHALREALAEVYPEIDAMELVDYRVRILDAAHGTDAVTRVLLETADHDGTWVTIGVAGNILEASWQALRESITYGLMRAGVPAR